jgi:hypothetical protein
VSVDPAERRGMRRRFGQFEGKTVSIRYSIGGGAGVARRERIYQRI